MPEEVYSRGKILDFWATKYSRPLLVSHGHNLQADAFLNAVQASTALVVPLFVSNRVMGSMQLFSGSGALTREDAQLLWILSLVAENQLTRRYANEGLIRFALPDGVEDARLLRAAIGSRDQAFGTQNTEVRIADDRHRSLQAVERPLRTPRGRPGVTGCLRHPEEGHARNGHSRAVWGRRIRHHSAGNGRGGRALRGPVCGPRWRARNSLPARRGRWNT